MVWGGGDYVVRDSDVLRTLADVRMASTAQVARLHASDHQSPAKRASACLRQLEANGLVESYKTTEREKIWRLTKAGREKTQVEYGAPVFRTRKEEHRLAVTDFYASLALIERPLIWESEYREEIDEFRTFSPDAFFVWRNKAWFAEVQRSPLTTKRWREKWRLYSAYFVDIERRRFQRRDRPVMPQIVIVTTQQASTVSAPRTMPIQILQPGGVPSVDGQGRDRSAATP